MNNIICLKHGSKYNYEYVNKLYNMVKRNTNLPFNFYCFTEDPLNLDKEIIVKQLPDINLHGWWYKPYFFKQDLFSKDEVIFYLDLDVVIINNIDKLLSFESNNILGFIDPLIKFNPSHKKLNSSVMKWKSGSFSYIWNNLEKNKFLCQNYKGDQDYIWDCCKETIEYYPEDWILSYKWQVRSRSELTNTRPKNFINIRNPDVGKDTSILVFHGNPKIHMVKDKIILDNWI